MYRKVNFSWQPQLHGAGGSSVSLCQSCGEVTSLLLAGSSVTIFGRLVHHVNGQQTCISVIIKASVQYLQLKLLDRRILTNKVRKLCTNFIACASSL